MFTAYLNPALMLDFFTIIIILKIFFYFPFGKCALFLKYGPVFVSTSFIFKQYVFSFIQNAVSYIKSIQQRYYKFIVLLTLTWLQPGFILNRCFSLRILVLLLRFSLMENMFGKWWLFKMLSKIITPVFQNLQGRAFNFAIVEQAGKCLL